MIRGQVESHQVQFIQNERASVDFVIGLVRSAAGLVSLKHAMRNTRRVLVTLTI